MYGNIGHLLGKALGGLPPEGACPPLEDLAALSENKLAGKERGRVLAHLAGCATCRETYTLACGLSPEVAPAGQSDFRWQVRRFAPLAAAAGIILVIISVPLLLTRNYESGIHEAVAPYAQRPERAANNPLSAVPEAPVPAESKKPRSRMESAQKTIMPLHKEKRKEAQAPIAVTEPEKGREPLPVEERRSIMPSLPPVPPARLASPEVAEKTPASEPIFMPQERKVAEAPPARKEAPEATEMPQQFAAKPRRQRLGVADSEGFSRRKRIDIDEEQKKKLAKGDAVISDRGRIEGLFKDLGLDTREFPLNDIKRVEVLWSEPRRDAAKAAPAAPATVPAVISLGDGVLTIVILEENPGGGEPGKKYRDPATKIPVGC